MSLTEHVLKAIERIDALEQRIAALEQMVAGGSSSVCPLCDSPRFKRVSAKPHPLYRGWMLDVHRCADCQHEEERQRNISE